MILSSRSVIFHFCFCHASRQHNFYCLYFFLKYTQCSYLIYLRCYQSQTTGCYQSQSMKNHSKHLAYGKMLEQITQFNRPENEHATRITCILILEHKQWELFMLSYRNILSWSTLYFFLQKNEYFVENSF